MQTLKFYLVIFTLAGIALFVDVNFIHPRGGFLSVIDFYDDEELYDTIEVETVAVEEIIEKEIVPVCSSESNGIDAVRDYLGRGSAPALEGKICVVQYFINEHGDGWTDLERKTATSRVHEAEAWLKDKASEYGTDVDFTTVSYEKNFAIDNLPTKYQEDNRNDKLLHKAFRSLNWTDHDAFVEHMKDKYDCDGVVLLVMVKGTGRSWACTYTRSDEEHGRTQDYAEGAIIFNTKKFNNGTTASLCAATVAHEILHLCGAWDFYEEEGIQDKEHADKAEQLFPKSIMLHENKDIYNCEIDEVTAWLVGLNGRKNWYAWFQPEVKG